MKKILTILFILFLLGSSVEASQMNDIASFKILFNSKTLADATPTGIFKVSIPASGYAGGSISYNVQTTDATDFQSHQGFVSFSAVNKAGVLTTDIVESATLEVNSNSASAQTDAWSIVSGTNEITITVNVDTTLVTPTSMIIYYTVILNSQQPIQPL